MIICETCNNEKTYSFTRGHCSGNNTIFNGTLSALTNIFENTLRAGNDKRGHNPNKQIKRVNEKPRTIDELVEALNNFEYNCAIGAPEYYYYQSKEQIRMNNN